MVEYRNAVRIGDRIDCEVNHAEFGWIPFTARANDPEPFGQNVWAALNEPGVTIPDGEDEQVAVEATRVQISLWLNANGFTDGLENAAIIAAAGAAGGEAVIRRREGQVFGSDDPFLTAAAPSLGIADLHAAITAAREL